MDVSIAERTPQTDPAMEALTIEVLELEENSQNFVVVGEPEYNLALHTLGRIKAIVTKVETKRKEWVKPLNDTVKKINTGFKDYLKPLELADTHIRNAVSVYRDKQRRIRQEEEARLRKEQAERQRLLEAEAAKNNAPAPPPLPVPVSTVPSIKKTETTAQGTVGGAMVWKFEIVNDAEVPREYCVPDIQKIRALVKAGLKNIPGIRIYQEEQLRVGRR